MPDYRYVWNNYNHPNLVLAYDMSTRTPAGLMKNLAKTGSIYDGTIAGAYAQNIPLLREKRSPSMEFDGVNNYISLASPVSGATEFSMIFWFRPYTNGTIWSRATGAVGTLYHYAQGYNMFYSGDYLVTKNYLKDYNAHMVAATFNDPSKFTWFIDGQFNKGYPSPSGTYWPDANAFIGRYFDNTLKFNGIIDNFLMFNKALRPSQISSIYRSGVPR